MSQGLVLDTLSHSYGDTVVVPEVSLTVAPGELLCLLGPSGCGKTTTLRIAAGLEEVRQGRVTLDGRLVSGDGVHIPPEHRHVGFLFQDYALFPHLNVCGNVEFGLDGLTRPARRQRALDMLAQVGMADYAGAWPHQLSGGQQQRVGLARALAPQPGLMLLDEPFSGLDKRLRDQIRDETQRVLKANGVATLMVTHDPEEAMFMAKPLPTRSEREEEIDGLLERGCYGDVKSTGMEKFLEGFPAEARRNLIFRHWDSWKQLLPVHMIPSGELQSMLRKARCPARPEEIGLSREQFGHAVFTAQLIRKRYTVLDVLYESGLLEQAIGEMLDRLY